MVQPESRLFHQIQKRMRKSYKVRAKVWLWPGGTHSTSSGQGGAWHFAHVDKKLSVELKEKYAKVRSGFGSIPVSVKLGTTKWKTSIFPDSRSGTYLLPLKASVRRAEGLSEGDTIIFTLEIR